MSVTFDLPPPKTDAACPASSSKMPCSPRKRFMPPSSDFNTSITSSGYQPVDRDHEDKGTCQDPRVRYPKAEAILQMFFRFCTIALNMTVLVFLHYVCKHPDYAVVAKKFYAAVAFSLLLNIAEIVSLGNPKLTPLIRRFPWLFSPRWFSSSPAMQPRFPRLPSAYLTLCEIAAFMGSSANAVMFLKRVITDDALRGDCPKKTCVMLEERYMIYSYAVEVFIALVHFVFLWVAFLHFLEKKGFGVMEEEEEPKKK